MKKIVIRILCAIVSVALVIVAVPTVILKTMPEYRDCVGDQSYDQKISGMYLLNESAKRDTNVIIYGSSELRTDYINTHPANFFAQNDLGFQVNLVGRGSCQSIIHALSIAASGDFLKNSKVVLITSPQSYVKNGIEPDMFMANFSKQQFLSVIFDKTVSTDVKKRLSARVLQNIERYQTEIGNLSGYEDIKLIAKAYAYEKFTDKIFAGVLYPYYRFEKYLFDNKDMIESAKIIKSAADKNKTAASNIDWEKEAEKALSDAKLETSSNEFGMRDSDYKKNVGNRLVNFKDKDKDLSYDESVEYDDLKLLLDICDEKGIKPLFVSVPLHAQWSDYTGFSKDKRDNYYKKVAGIVNEYGFKMLDLSQYENEKYFLCDTMHLGWKGWLKVNEEIARFYFEDGTKG